MKAAGGDGLAFYGGVSTGSGLFFWVEAILLPDSWQHEAMVNHLSTVNGLPWCELRISGAERGARRRVDRPFCASRQWSLASTGMRCDSMT